MKTTFLILILLTLCQQNFSQETDIKIKLNEITLKSIENDKLIDYNLLNKAGNKIIMFEFWETWCGECIEGMPQLKV